MKLVVLQINKIMKLSVLKIAGATLVASAISAITFAAPIAGRIDIGAFGTFVEVDFAANSVNFTTDGSNAVVAAATGNYSAFAPPVVTLASYKDFQYDGDGLPQTIWEINATTFFRLASITSVIESANGLVLTGLGTAFLTGFDSTPGLWSFSADRNLGETVFSFSSTTQVPPPSVPDSGSTVALLGSALVAMGLISRRRRA
jgi:hypothetical protein